MNNSLTSSRSLFPSPHQVRHGFLRAEPRSAGCARSGQLALVVLGHHVVALEEVQRIPREAVTQRQKRERGGRRKEEGREKQVSSRFLVSPPRFFLQFHSLRGNRLGSLLAVFLLFDGLEAR